MGVEPGTKAFLDAIARAGGPPLHTLSPQAARAALAELQSREAPKRGGDVEDLVLPVGPTGQVPVRIVRPRGGDVVPAAMFFHGNGCMLGDRDTHDRLVREIVAGAGIALVVVDYERAPEARFPLALEQAWAATRYVAEAGEQLRVAASRLAVVGDGAGGNLAAAVCLLAKKRGGPRIAQQVLFYPVVDADFDRASYVDFADGPWLTAAAMRAYWDAWCPDPGLRRHPLAAPLRASLTELEGLPPALVVTAENDVLRDEGEAYAAWLAAAGVPVTSVRYNGAIHDFVMLDALRDTAPARAAVAQACGTLREALLPERPRVLEPA